MSLHLCCQIPQGGVAIRSTRQRKNIIQEPKYKSHWDVFKSLNIFNLCKISRIHFTVSRRKRERKEPLVELGMHIRPLDQDWSNDCPFPPEGPNHTVPPQLCPAFSLGSTSVLRSSFASLLSHPHNFPETNREAVISGFPDSQTRTGPGMPPTPSSPYLPPGSIALGNG